MAMVRVMLELLASSNIMEVIEVSMVILGHLIQSEHRSRNKLIRHHILNHNVLNRVISLLGDVQAERLIPAIAWLSSTLIEDPMPSDCRQLFGNEFINRLIGMCLHEEESTVANAMSALCGVVECSSFSWYLLIQHPKLSSFLAMFNHRDSSLAFLAVKMFAVITSTEDESVMDKLIDRGLIESFLTMRSHQESSMRLWVAFGLSNMVTGMASHTDMLWMRGAIQGLVQMIHFEKSCHTLSLSSSSVSSTSKQSHDNEESEELDEQNEDDEAEDDNDEIGIKISASQPIHNFEPQVISNAACALANSMTNATPTKAVRFSDIGVIEALSISLDYKLPEYVTDTIIASLIQLLTEAEPLQTIELCKKLNDCNASDRLRHLIKTRPAGIDVANVEVLLMAVNSIKFASKCVEEEAMISINLASTKINTSIIASSEKTLPVRSRSLKNLSTKTQKL